MASHSQQPQSERLPIGITGRIGSGKTTVGHYMQSRYGFQYLRYSAVLADWQAQDDKSRGHLQKVGWEIMAGGLQAELNRRLIAQIAPEQDVAVDGLRHPLDYETLRKVLFPSFRLLFIDSSPKLRYDRLKAKGKYVESASFLAADSHPVEQHIESLRNNADSVIGNRGSLQELYDAVDEAIANFRKES